MRQNLKVREFKGLKENCKFGNSFKIYIWKSEKVQDLKIQRARNSESDRRKVRRNFEIRRLRDPAIPGLESVKIQRTCRKLARNAEVQKFKKWKETQEIKKSENQRRRQDPTFQTTYQRDPKSLSSSHVISRLINMYRVTCKNALGETWAPCRSNPSRSRLVERRSALGAVVVASRLQPR